MINPMLTYRLAQPEYVPIAIITSVITNTGWRVIKRRWTIVGMAG